MEDNTTKRARLRASSKKAVVKEAGYQNIKSLCNGNPDMVSNGKAPSKNAIIAAIM